MAEGHFVKLDRNAFNRGVEDMITLRPLREMVSAVVRGPSKSGAVVSTESYDAKARDQNVKKRQASSAK